MATRRRRASGGGLHELCRISRQRRSSAPMTLSPTSSPLANALHSAVFDDRGEYKQAMMYSALIARVLEKLETVDADIASTQE
jgi:hypothetical protein